MINLNLIIYKEKIMKLIIRLLNLVFIKKILFKKLQKNKKVKKDVEIKKIKLIINKIRIVETCKKLSHRIFKLFKILK